jgi:S-ribosylhomocysteine lyase LuxS involved in autoinducer biosynthesis
MGNIHFGSINKRDINVTVPKKNFLLPNNNHPFEHLVVMGEIQHIKPDIDK